MLLPKVHLHLHARDLSRSREFYERFLGGPPVKTKPGYVKFLPVFAPLNLAISQLPPSASRVDRAASPAVSHVGVQLPSPDEVRAHFARVKSAGIAVREEMDVDCCHANQDKFWVVDPDGAEWEVYHLNYDLEDEMPSTATRPVSLGLPMAKAAGGCCSH